ncbi:MAG: MFS transporter [Rhodobacterales bacterium 32-66-7]|nr:MAG: MFS transporter [Rhodobacterales bacterium 12-65-15]OYX26964.1 MAG: MFS transporter [Rhodobacterales bacterium 32-66-7]
MTASTALPGSSSRIGGVLRFLLIAVIAFLTLVDLFATQVIIPGLTLRYGVSPAVMGAAVSACTLGMAAASLLVALYADRIDRRAGIVLALALLSVPTVLLAWAPTVGIFAGLRILQGLCMATAFSLTLAYLGERMTGAAAARAFAAYVTGNVASNLIGRFVASGVAGEYGIDASFYVFAALNIAGAALVLATIHRSPKMKQGMNHGRSAKSAVAAHLANPRLRAAFAFGFCILFVFIGLFTYVNFELGGPRFGLSMTALGSVYFVFLPSIFTTPLAGALAARIGVRDATIGGIALALIGLGLMTLDVLVAVLFGMALVAIGTFLAQALATGFVSRAAKGDRAAASGLYLAAYFTGGLVGAVILGQVYTAFGWTALSACVALVLGLAALLCRRFDKLPTVD